MKMLKCPQCGGKLSPSVAPLHPMQAIAADMLEQGVVFRCPNCALYSTDASSVECPKCGKKNLTASLERNPKSGHSGRKKPAGRIICESCGWEQKLSSHK